MGSESRQILSLVRIPISPLRLREREGLDFRVPGAGNQDTRLFVGKD